MNLTVIFNVLLNVFATNRRIFSLIYLDDLSPILRTNNYNFSILPVDLNAVKNVTIPVNLILKHFKRTHQISVVLNYDCDQAKDIIKMVSAGHSMKFLSLIIATFLVFSK